jgi:O-antigen/teichoic acid export membrane protein
LFPAKGSFGANMLTLMTGTTLVQVMMIAATPILTRLYAPESFGALAIFTSIILILSPLVSWRFEQAIVLPETETDAFHILVIATTLILLTVLLISFGVYFWGRAGARLLDMPQIVPWLGWIPLCLFLTSLFETFRFWYMRQNKFRSIVVGQVYQTSTTAISQISYGLIAIPGPGGLIGGNIAGRVVGVAALAGGVIRRSRVLASGFNLRRLWQLMCQYKDMARYALFTNFLSGISGNMIPLTLNYFFGTALVGLFMISQRLMNLPSQLIIDSLWQTTYSELGRLTLDEQRLRLRKIHNYVAFIFAFPMVAVSFFPERIEVVLGPKWQGIGDIIIPLAILVYINALARSVSYFIVFEHYAEQAIANVSLFLLRLGSVIIGGIYLTSLKTIYLFAFASILYYAILDLRWAFYFSDTKHYILHLVTSLAVNIVLLFCFKYLFANTSFLSFMILISALFVLYYSILLILFNLPYHSK